MKTASCAISSRWRFSSSTWKRPEPTALPLAQLQGIAVERRPLRRRDSRCRQRHGVYGSKLPADICLAAGCARGQPIGIGALATPAACCTPRERLFVLTILPDPLREALPPDGKARSAPDQPRSPGLPSLSAGAERRPAAGWNWSPSDRATSKPGY